MGPPGCDQAPLVWLGKPLLGTRKWRYSGGKANEKPQNSLPHRVESANTLAAALLEAHTGSPSSRCHNDAIMMTIRTPPARCNAR
eukprot:1742827-Rhodomonas_salina.1